MRFVNIIAGFVFKWTGLESLTERIKARVTSYRVRLNIVPTSYKLFLVTLGVVSGLTWSNVYEYYQSASTVNFEGVSVVFAKEVEVVKESKTVIVPIETLADDIWNRESTRGKNNYSQCEAVGKINGIGYGIPGNGSYLCFNSHDEEMTVLSGWLTAKRASGLSDKAMLCLYSGSNYSECK